MVRLYGVSTNCEGSMKRQKITGIAALVCAVGTSMYLWGGHQAATQREQARLNSPTSAEILPQQQPDQPGRHVLTGQQTQPPAPPAPPPPPPVPGTAPVGKP